MYILVLIVYYKCTFSQRSNEILIGCILTLCQHSCMYCKHDFCLSSLTERWVRINSMPQIEFNLFWTFLKKPQVHIYRLLNSCLSVIINCFQLGQNHWNSVFIPQAAPCPMTDGTLFSHRAACASAAWPFMTRASTSARRSVLLALSEQLFISTSSKPVRSCLQYKSPSDIDYFRWPACSK